MNYVDNSVTHIFSVIAIPVVIAYYNAGNWMLPGTRDMLIRHKERKIEASMKSIPSLPKPVTFCPKFNLPKLSDYSKPSFPANYWSKWTKRTLDMMLPGSSWVSSTALRDLAA